MFLRLIKFFSISTLLTVLVLSCHACNSNDRRCTKLLEGCIEDSEIHQLDQLFIFFEQRMQAKYNARNEQEALRYYVYDVAKSNYDTNRMTISDEERELLRQYMASPAFSVHWTKFEDEYDGVIFFPKSVYKDCYIKEDTKLASFFRSLSLMGSLPYPHELALGIMDMIEEGDKLDDSIGISIFIYVYLYELVNWQIADNDKSA